MLHHLVSLFAISSPCFAAPGLTDRDRDVASSGTFNVLSLNLARDNSIHRDIDKDATDIGRILSQSNYTLIGVQGGSGYYKNIHAYAGHRFDTNPPKDPFDTGLYTFSYFSWIDEYRPTEHDRCHDGKGHPCSEVFSFMRLQMDEGVYIDIINLDNDYLRRHRGIEQVSDFINTHSIGNAVIVFGNTDSLYSRKDNIGLLTTQNNLTDAWVQAVGPTASTNAPVCRMELLQNINCEVADKVFYRGSPIIDLSATRFSYDTSRFLSPEDNTHRLTDRYPIRAEFKYTLKPGLRQSNLYGGPYGAWYNDLPKISSSSKLSNITLRGSRRLDGVSFGLASGEIVTHGGSGGDSFPLVLDPKECIISVRLCQGNRKGKLRIFYAQVATNQKKTVKAGTETTDCMIFGAPAGYGVVGAYGQDGREMDQLGLISAEQQCGSAN